VEQQLDPAVDAPHQHRAGTAAVLAGTPDVDGVPVALPGVLAAHRPTHRAQDRQIRLGGLSCSMVTIISQYPPRETYTPYGWSVYSSMACACQSSGDRPHCGAGSPGGLGAAAGRADLVAVKRTTRQRRATQRQRAG
jgi:hypothetical protein